MIALESKVTGLELDYPEWNDRLEPHGFVLGGGWDYSGGAYDRSLDGEARTVWLRIPFQVIAGRLDPDAPQEGTRVKIGTPVVLRHLYREGDDPSADMNVIGATFNQFQSPADPDAEVPSHFVGEAEEVLRKIEASF